MDESFKLAHAQGMQHAAVARSQTHLGIVVLLTGNGKGKAASAFGSLYRALGHGQRADVVPFISGTHGTGEVTFLQQAGLLGQGAHAQADYHAKATGFSRDSPGWNADQAGADSAWRQAQRM